MISVKAIGEIVLGQISPLIQLASLETHVIFVLILHSTYPERIISSSMPYNFICCSPQPSLIRRGIHFFRSPVRFGVWNIRISTRSGPNSATKEHSREALEGLGVSRVPRRASVSIDTLRSGFSRRACDIVSTSSNSVLPIYKVERYTRLLALRILFCTSAH